jgi:hypothetical protein
MRLTKRLAAGRARLYGLGGAGIAAAAATLALATPASALGPAGPFQDCPVDLATFTSCLNTSTTSGSFTLGNATVPLTGTTTLQGGLLQVSLAQDELLGAIDGNTLIGPPLNVPGGLTGLMTPTGLGLIGFIFGELNTVTAQVQLAGPNPPGGATNASLFLSGLAGTGTAVALPVKVKLNNPLLGNTCYIGSDSNPIQLNLTAGTTTPPPPNTPITGNPGTQGFVGVPDGTQTVVALQSTGVSLVDNSFAVPGASGCGPIGLQFLVDLALDLKEGLPAAAGHNTAILNGSYLLASWGQIETANHNQ